MALPQLLAGLFLLGAAVHPNSVSQSILVVDGAEVRVEFAFQTLTLVEELGLDRDGDGELDDAELGAARPLIGDYVLEHFRVLDPTRDDARLPGEVLSITTARRAEPMDEQWVTTDLRFSAPAPLEDVAVEFDPFRQMNAAHLDFASLEWNGAPLAYFGFGLGEDRWDFDTPAERRPGVIRAFLRRGRDSLLGEPEALVLLTALLLAGAGGRAAWWAAGLLVVFHAAGLAWGALAPWTPPRSFLGLAGSLSAAYLACDTLLRSVPRLAWLEASLFGVALGIHAGMEGSRAVADEPMTSVALGAWVAATAGGLALAAALLIGLFALVPGERRGEVADGAPAWLAARPMRVVLCLAVAAVGFWRFADRAGFLG